MVRHLQHGNFDDPWLLSDATKTRLATWSTTPEFRGIELLWQCAKCFKTDGNSDSSTPVNNPKTDALRVAELLRSKTIENTCYARRDTELRTLMQLPDNYNKLTPMAKTDALGKSGATQRLVIEFLDNGGKLNIRCSAQSSLRSAASGVNNYIRFRTLTNSTAFPPSTGTVRPRSATFNPGETYGIYINHVRKAAILLGHDGDWLIH